MCFKRGGCVMLCLITTIQSKNHDAKNHKASNFFSECP